MWFLINITHNNFQLYLNRTSVYSLNCIRVKCNVISPQFNSNFHAQWEMENLKYYINNIYIYNNLCPACDKIFWLLFLFIFCLPWINLQVIYDNVYVRHDKAIFYRMNETRSSGRPRVMSRYWDHHNSQSMQGDRKGTASGPLLKRMSRWARVNQGEHNSQSGRGLEFTGSVHPTSSLILIPR